MINNINIKNLEKFISSKIQPLEKLNYAINTPKFSKLNYFGGGFLTHLILLYLKDNHKKWQDIELKQYDGDLDLFYINDKNNTNFININEVVVNGKMPISLAAKFNNGIKQLSSFFKNNELKLNFSSRQNCSYIDLFIDFDLNYSTTNPVIRFYRSDSSTEISYFNPNFKRAAKRKKL